MVRASGLRQIPNAIEKKDALPTHTIGRAVDILTILREGAQGVTDISRRLGISKATISRMLKTLEITGLVMRDPDSREYCMGPLVAMLASDHLTTHQNLCICASGEMEHLWRLSRETVSLLIQAGTHGMYLEEYVSPQFLRYKLRCFRGTNRMQPQSGTVEI